MSLSPEILKKLLGIFKQEFAEQLQVITDGLLALEKDPSNQEIVNTVFRAAHTIKGSGRSVGLEAIGEIAHAMENIFNKMREASLQLTPEINDACLAAVDQLREAMIFFEKSPDKKFDTTEIIDRLNKISGQKKNSNEHSFIPAESKLKKEVTTPGPAPIQTETSEYLSVSVDKIAELTAISDSLIGNTYFLQIYAKQLMHIRKLLKKITKIQPDLADFDEVKNIFQILDSMDLETRSRNNELSLLTHQLQDNLQEVRLVPAAIILRPLSRLVRDISRELNKEVELKLEGVEIEVDRAVLEYVKAPLIHLIRNSIDHGIKSKGVITISVSYQTGHVRIIVADNGRGIDSKEVLRVALEKKLIDESEIANLSESEILNFVFYPGFSTKKSVTELSGRGVGLDVVQNNIYRAKGYVNIESKLGEGTRVIIDLPLTLSADRGTWLRLGDQLFIIPTVVVTKIIKVDRNILQITDNELAIFYQNQTIPLRDLAELLGLHNQNKADFENRYIIIIERNKLLLALLVDEVLGEEEIIIKSLAPPLSAMPAIIGASLTARGEIVMILSAANIFKRAALYGKIRSENLNKKVGVKSKKILVVDDSITTRTMEITILETHGHLVQSATNGYEAWQRLQHEDFDIVVSDIEMPVMNGFELTKKIKSDPRFQDLKVIIVSSIASEMNLQRGAEVGADACIVKSQYEGKALLDIINQFSRV